MVIFCAGFTGVGRRGRTKRLNGSLAEMEGYFADAVAGLRTIPAEPGRTRELWVCGQYTALRFFRIEPFGIIEIGRDGKPFGEPGGRGGTRGFPPSVAGGKMGFN
jgi:hypothetical protein